MKKRVGIMTFHRAHNVGAMLQAFALQQTLAEKYDAKIVDYRCEAIESSYYPSKGILSFIKQQVKWVVRYSKEKYSREKRKNFQSFAKDYLVTTDTKYFTNNIQEVNQQFDAFISGSDQVWNMELTGNDMNYLLEFTEPAKRYSYAGSFGNREAVINSERKEDIQKLLNSMVRILIREKEGFGILKELQVDTGKSVELVCDPVFLLSKEQWEEKLQLKTESKPYLLLFLVAPQTHALQVARKIARKHNLEIRYINSAGRFNECPTDCVNVMTSGPKQLLELLMSAEYVVTTSFHGMALSIVFNKQFFYEMNHEKENRNSRLVNLAEIYGLHEREILTDDLPDTTKRIDYPRINRILKEYSLQSQNILMDTLSEI